MAPICLLVNEIFVQRKLTFGGAISNAFLFFPCMCSYYQYSYNQFSFHNKNQPCGYWLFSILSILGHSNPSSCLKVWQTVTDISFLISLLIRTLSTVPCAYSKTAFTKVSEGHKIILATALFFPGGPQQETVLVIVLLIRKLSAHRTMDRMRATSLGVLITTTLYCCNVDNIPRNSCVASCASIKIKLCYFLMLAFYFYKIQ